MKSIELLATGIRLVGFYAIIVGLRTAAYQYQSALGFRNWFEDQRLPLFFYLSCIEIALIFLAAFIMIKFPGTLAGKLLPRTDDAGSSLNVDRNGLEIILYSALGIFILSWAIPDFINNAIWIWYLQGDEAGYNGEASTYVIHEAVTVVEIAIGTYLCFQSKGLAALLQKFRSLGEA